MSDDFWGTFSPPEQINAPAYLLKQQAAALYQKTKGIVVAFVRSTSAGEDGSFWVGFDLGSQYLPEYNYRLLQMNHPPAFYPLSLVAFGERRECRDEPAFRQALAEVLSSPKTTQVVEAIMAQAAAVTPGLS
jgi:hypothetical protein